MGGQRTALIVASDEFEHPGLSRLRAPAADARALADVLGDPHIGGFSVRVVHNVPSYTVQGHIEDLFAEGQLDDLLLLHFSGHGLKSDSGELFFATANTRPDRLASTAVPADFVQRCMRGSRSRSIVLFLDCCYGGAFGQGVAVRASGAANVLESFPAGKLGGGRGRAVITASSAMEYAFEGSDLASDQQQQPSVFTAAVVEGLSSGAADRDEDGLVSLNELYDYVFDRVREQNPNQTPSRDIELQGELYVARSQRKRLRPLPLPPDVTAALQDHNMYTRAGAVGELENRLGSTDLGVALGAHQALAEVARSDISYVAAAAKAALATASATATPAELRFDPSTGDPTAPDLRVRLHGPPIATAVTSADSDPWLTVSPSAEGAVVAINTPSTDERTGTVTLTTAAGQVLVVRVVAEGQPVPPAAEPTAPPVPEPTAPPVAEPPAPPVSVPTSEPTAEPTGPPAAEPTRPTAAAAAEPTTPPTAPTAPAASGAPEPTPTSAGPSRLSVLGGRTALASGALMLLSIVAPEFIYGDELFAQRRAEAITLLVLGALAVAVGGAVLWARRLRRVAAWAAIAVGAVSLFEVPGLLNLWTQLDWPEFYFGYWLALAGCLLMAAAAIPTALGLRRATVPDTATAVSPAVSPLTALTALSGWVALVGGGLMLMGTFAVRFSIGQQAFVEPTIVWAYFFAGALGVAAGAATLWLRTQPAAGPGLAVGAGATAVWGMSDLPRIWRAEGVDQLNSGFWIELVAHPALIASGVLALVALRRGSAVAFVPSALAGRVSWIAGAIGLAGAIPFVRVALANWESSEAGDAVHDLQMATFMVLIPLLATALRPPALARWTLLAWAVGAAGIVIAYWRLLNADGAPLYGVPYVLLVLAALVIVAVAGLSQRAAA